MLLTLAAPAIAQPVSRPHVAWAKNANIYEVNIRQFTPEGTIPAFAKHLPRLKKMADARSAHRREEPQGDTGELLFDPRLHSRES
jgi:hypothetical protein